METIKKLIPTQVKDFVKAKLNLQGHTFSYLLKKPRFQRENIELFGASFEILDGPSFSFLYQEIFVREIYKFKSNTTTPVIIDLGANIGVSILYFKKAFPNARIIAFEADPTVFEVLKINLRKQGLHDVELVNKAIWKEKTTLNFQPEGADAGRISSGKTGSTFEVETEDINELMGQYETVDFLKIDIEGAEVEVLQRMSDELSKVKRIFIEYHSFGDIGGLNQILNLLKTHHFRVYIDSPGFMNNSPLFEMKPQNGMDFQLNVFAVNVG